MQAYSTRTWLASATVISRTLKIRVNSSSRNLTPLLIKDETRCHWWPRSNLHPVRYTIRPPKSEQALGPSDASLRDTRYSTHTPKWTDASGAAMFTRELTWSAGPSPQPQFCLGVQMLEPLLFLLAFWLIILWSGTASDGNMAHADDIEVSSTGKGIQARQLISPLIQRYLQNYFCRLPWDSATHPWRCKIRFAPPTVYTSSIKTMWTRMKSIRSTTPRSPIAGMANILQTTSCK